MIAEATVARIRALHRSLASRWTLGGLVDREVADEVAGLTGLPLARYVGFRIEAPVLGAVVVHGHRDRPRSTGEPPLVLELVVFARGALDLAGRTTPVDVPYAHFCGPAERRTLRDLGFRPSSERWRATITDDAAVPSMLDRALALDWRVLGPAAVPGVELPPWASGWVDVVGADETRSRTVEGDVTRLLLERDGEVIEVISDPSGVRIRHGRGGMDYAAGQPGTAFVRACIERDLRWRTLPRLGP